MAQGMVITYAMYAVLVVWAFVSFVLWYFYRHAPQSLPVRFRSLFGAISVLALATFAYLGWRGRPDFQPARIAAFPFPERDSSATLTWRSLVLPELLTQSWRQLDQTQLLAYKLEWILQAAAADSLGQEAYARHFARGLRLDYLVYGRLRPTADGLEVYAGLYDLRRDEVALTEQAVVEETGLGDFSENLAQRVLARILPQWAESAPRPDLCCPSQIENYVRGKWAWLKGDDALPFARRAVEDSTSVAALNFLAERLIARAAALQREKGDAQPVFKRAKTILFKSRALRPEDATSARLLAELYLANEKWNEAQRYLLESYRRNPYDPETLLALTRLHPARYAELGYANDAELLQRAVLTNPGCFAAHLRLADYYALKNRYDLAEKHIQAVLGLNPTHVDGLMARGKVLMAKKDWVGVLETYEKVLALEPNNADVFFNIGVVYYHQNDFHNALQYFEHAIELSDHLDSYLYLAYIHEKQGEVNKAIPYLRARIRKRTGPDDRFAEEARKHLYEIMQRTGALDSLRARTQTAR